MKYISTNNKKAANFFKEKGCTLTTGQFWSGKEGDMFCPKGRTVTKVEGEFVNSMNDMEFFKFMQDNNLHISQQ